MLLFLSLLACDPVVVGLDEEVDSIGQHTRADALRERDRWREAGATVAMCEQVSTGGVAYDIAGRRHGGGRMHGGKQAATGEFLSVHWPGMAGETLFGGAP